MSLSFVSSAVQIGTSNGGFEEKPIENKETEAVNRRNAHKPLFEQLRSNQDEDQEKKDEIQREIMRSTCALDDDDVAHLDSIERQRSDRARNIKERTENELNMFRAARALKQQATLLENNEDGDDRDSSPEGQALTIVPTNGNNFETLGRKETVISVEAASSLPMIKVKKRKRRTNPIDTKSKHMHTEKRSISKQNVNSKSESKNTDEACSFSNQTGPALDKGVQLKSTDAEHDGSGCGLSSLLSGYGTSSDEEDQN